MGQPPPASFLPSRDGFGFSNAWPREPAISLPFPFRRIGIGNAAAGLCGGMVFAACDYWRAGQAPPASRPAAGTPLYQFIVRRLIDSWHVPAGVLKYYLWMMLPDADASLRPFGHTIAAVRGVGWRTITRQWPLVRASIDAGQPAALGLVTVASAWPGNLGHNHQVLGYGYEQTGGVTTMHVYDPNSGPADDIRISFDCAAPAGRTTFTHNINISRPVRGFFLTSYSPALTPGA